MTVFLLTIAVFALFFIFMSVRLIFIKGGEFRGTCATQSPYLTKQGITCGMCGKTLGEGDANCGDPEKANLEMPKVK